MKIYIKSVLLITVILLLLFFLAGCLPDLFTPPPPKGVINGRVMVPGSETAKDITGWVPVANATVTLTDSEGVTHTVTADEDGYYTFTNIAVNADTVITATATIDGNTVVMKDIIPQAVAATEDYDAETADAESTALGLIVEELTEQGLTPEDINLEEIQASDNFTAVVEQVSSVLEENGDITTDPDVTEVVNNTTEEIINLPEPSPPAPTPSYTVTYNSQGGSAVAPQTVEHGGKAAEPTDPTRDGYNFGGWYKESECTNAWVFATDTVTSNVTLYTQWNINTYTVTFDKNGGDTEADPMTKTAEHGGNVGTLPTAPTKTGYTFDSWNTAAGGGGTVFTAATAVTADITVYAQWNYTLVMSKTGSGTGTTTPTLGNHTYNYGYEITISASPATSSTFNGWSGDATGTSNVTLTMNENKSVTATFTLKSYTITASAGANGDISPSGAVGVNHGADQIFTITADANYHIADVVVDGSSVGAVGTYTFTSVTADHTISATFVIDTYTLTMNTAGTGSGTVTADPVKATYNHGETVTISASADASSDFIGWSDDLSGSTNPTTITMNSNKTVTATFTLKSYTITASAGANGSISPSGAVGVNHGADQTFTITAVANYHIADVVVDGGSVGTGSTYTFTDVTANHTIAATFAIDTYTLTMNTAGTGSGTVSPTAGVHTYNYEDEITISASPATSSIFNGWSGDAIGTSNVTLTMTENKNVTATFTLKSYTITASAGANGDISLSGAVGVNHGADQIFTITADANYHIADVVVDESSVGAVGTYTFTSVTADHTISATFAIDTYTVTYSGNGSTSGTVPTGPVDYNYEAEVEVLGNTDNLVKTGYTFDGWNTAADGSGNGGRDYTAGDNFNMGTSNVTLYAQWNINTYTVTFNKNGGDTKADPMTKTAEHGGNVGTLPTAPTKAGYTFASWNTAAGGGGTEFTAATAVTADTTVYAQWNINTYTVTYNGNDNTGGTIPAGLVNYNYEAEVTVLGKGSLVKTQDGISLLFEGWNIAVDGSGNGGTDYSEGNTFNMGSANVTLYAQWSILRGTGPAGGLIFYDDEADGVDNITGARYLEAAPSDQHYNEDYTVEWGCCGTLILGDDDTDIAVGTGEQNTINILAGCATNGIAARLCDAYSTTVSEVTYDDWFLPSQDELDKMWVNLKKGTDENNATYDPIGGFAATYYWSSSEYSANNAWYQRFNNGSQNNKKKNNNTYRVRAVRVF